MQNKFNWIFGYQIISLIKFSQFVKKKSFPCQTEVYLLQLEARNLS